MTCHSQDNLAVEELDSDDAPFAGDDIFDDVLTNNAVHPESSFTKSDGRNQKALGSYAPYPRMEGPKSSAKGDRYAMDAFFRGHGAWRPPEPCLHCKELRLQCFMLQTTAANPNPVTSCSSCVALYRQCSLAEPGRSKRGPSSFETSQPVIGQLHGLHEAEDATYLADPASSQAATAEQSLEAHFTTKASKKSSARSNARTRPLRQWWNSHEDQPYPSESEKAMLLQESGLSLTQITNWFSNARRRRKQMAQASSTAKASHQLFRQGSPMPASNMAQLTPLERWKHSPPAEEPADLSEIERAIGNNNGYLPQETMNLDDFISFPPPFDMDDEWSSLPDSMNSSLLHAPSSCGSQQSSSTDSHSSMASSGARSNDGAPRISKRSQRRQGSIFHCTTCAKTFTRNADRLRHQRAIHSDCNEWWMCSSLLYPGESSVLVKAPQSIARCVYCGHLNPDTAHIASHNFSACDDRAPAERTFARKDHLWQHLQKFHRCRKWEGWALGERIERLCRFRGS